MKTVEVNFTAIDESLKNLITKVNENITIVELLKTIINSVDSSWEDYCAGSSTIYKEKSLMFVAEMENNIQTLKALMYEISKAMLEYIDNEDTGSTSIQSVQI